MNRDQFNQFLSPIQLINKCMRAAVWTTTAFLDDLYYKIRNIKSNQYNENGWAQTSKFEIPAAVELSNSKEYDVVHEFNYNIDLNIQYPNGTLISNIGPVLINQHFLLTGQIDQIENGVYVLTSNGTTNRSYFANTNDSFINVIYNGPSGKWKIIPQPIDLGSGGYSYEYPTLTDKKIFKLGGDYLLGSEFEYRFLTKSDYINKFVEYTYNTIHTSTNPIPNETTNYITRTPNKVWLCGQFGLLVKVENLTNPIPTWTLIKSNVKENLNSIYFNNNYGWAVGNKCTIIKTSNSGIDWEIIKIEGTENLNNIKFYDKNTGIIVGDRGIILTTLDGGSTWTRLPITNNSLKRKLYDVFLYKKIDNTIGVYIAGANGLLIKTVLTSGILTQIKIINSNLILTNESSDLTKFTHAPYVWDNIANDVVFRERLFLTGDNGTVLIITPNSGIEPIITQSQINWEIKSLIIPELNNRNILESYFESHVPNSTYTYNAPYTNIPPLSITHNALSTYPGITGSSGDYWFPARLYLALDDGNILETRYNINNPNTATITRKGLSILSTNATFETNIENNVFNIIVNESSVFVGNSILDQNATRPYSTIFNFGKNLYSSKLTYNYIEYPNYVLTETLLIDTTLRELLKPKLVILDKYIASKIQSDIQPVYSFDIVWNGISSYSTGDGWIDWADTVNNITPIRTLLSWFNSEGIQDMTYRTYIANTSIHTINSGLLNTFSSLNATQTGLNPGIYVNAGDWLEITVEDLITDDILFRRLCKVSSVSGPTVTLDSGFSDEELRILSGNSDALVNSNTPANTNYRYRIINTNYFDLYSIVNSIPLPLNKQKAFAEAFTNWLNEHPILGGKALSWITSNPDELKGYWDYVYEENSKKITLNVLNNIYPVRGHELTGSTIPATPLSFHSDIFNLLDVNNISTSDLVYPDDLIFGSNYTLIDRLQQLDPTFITSYKLRDYNGDIILPDTPTLVYNSTITLLNDNLITSTDSALLDFKVGSFCYFKNMTTSKISKGVWLIKNVWYDSEDSLYKLEVQNFGWLKILNNSILYDYSMSTSDSVRLISDMRLDEISMLLEHTNDEFGPLSRIATDAYGKAFSLDEKYRDNVSCTLYTDSKGRLTLDIYDFTDLGLLYNVSNVSNIIENGSYTIPYSITSNQLKSEPNLVTYKNLISTGYYRYIYYLGNNIWFILIGNDIYLLNDITSIWTYIISYENLEHIEKYSKPLDSNFYWALCGSNGLRILQWDNTTLEEITSTSTNWPISNPTFNSTNSTKPLVCAHYIKYKNVAGLDVYKLWLSRRYEDSGVIYEELSYVNLYTGGSWSIYKKIQDPNYFGLGFTVVPDLAGILGYNDENIFQVKRFGLKHRLYVNTLNLGGGINIDNFRQFELDYTIPSQNKDYLSYSIIKDGAIKKPIVKLLTTYPVSAEYRVWLGTTGSNSGITQFRTFRNGSNLFQLDDEPIKYDKNNYILGNQITSLNTIDDIVYWTSDSGLEFWKESDQNIRVLYETPNVLNAYYDPNIINNLALLKTDSALIENLGNRYYIGGILGLKTLTLVDGLTLSEIQNEFPWLLSAEIRNAIVGKKTINGIKTLLWYSGEWLCGTWQDGIWYSGTWYGGRWLNGIWNSVEVSKLSDEFIISNINDNFKSQWLSGIWTDGIWNAGTWWSGVWENGKHYLGEWYNGCWVFGEWYDGQWYGGLWYDGYFYKGTFNQDNVASHWYDGYWYGGEFENGTWHNGEFTTINISSDFGTRSTKSNRAIWLSGRFLKGNFWSGRSTNPSNEYYNVDNYSSIWYNGQFEGGIWYGGKWILGKFLNGVWKNGHWVGYYDIPLIGMGSDITFGSGQELLTGNYVDSNNVNLQVLNINTTKDLYFKGKTDRYTNGYTLWIGGDFNISSNDTKRLGERNNMLETADYKNHKIAHTNSNNIKIFFEWDNTGGSYSNLSIYSEFAGGTWESGVWENGVFTGGTFLTGIMQNGVFLNGDIYA